MCGPHVHMVVERKERAGDQRRRGFTSPPIFPERPVVTVIRAGVNIVTGEPESNPGEPPLTDEENAQRNALQQKAKELGIAELNVPKRIIITKQVPLLGTGKINYPGVKSLAETEYGAAA